MRTFLIETLERAAAECQFTVLSGLTGTGKTDVLAPMQQSIDLEGLANHRGSSFGKHVSAQPSQIDFENNLRSEEHTSELQSRPHLVCRLLLEKKKKKRKKHHYQEEYHHK